MRLLCTKVWPVPYHVLSLHADDPISAWQLPKDRACDALPEDLGLRRRMREFYESVLMHYREERPGPDTALDLIEKGVACLTSAKRWWEKKKPLEDEFWQSLTHRVAGPRWSSIATGFRPIWSPRPELYLLCFYGVGRNWGGTWELNAQSVPQEVRWQPVSWTQFERGSVLNCEAGVGVFRGGIQRGFDSWNQQIISPRNAEL